MGDARTFKLALAQCGYPLDRDVLAQVEAHAGAAQQAGAQILAFPENLMAPRNLTADEVAQIAESLDGPFAQGIASIAAGRGLWIVFTMYEHNPSGRPYNTAVVMSSDGSVAGSYRKCHLYDAHGIFESDRTSAGSHFAAPIATPFCTIGLGICYDLRFPELARSLAVAGADLILFPAAWHDGPHKEEHWQTLLRARAIENECYVAGICHAGKRFVERSMVSGPLGTTLEAEVLAPIAGSDDRLFVTEIDPSAIAAARDAMPVFEHRRPELY